MPVNNPLFEQEKSAETQKPSAKKHGIFQVLKWLPFGHGRVIRMLVGLKRSPPLNLRPHRLSSIEKADD